MDNIGQISLENTVKVKIDYELNQELLVKNFTIIMDCLKDLKAQQDKHQVQLNTVSSLKEMFEKFKEQMKQNDHNHSNNNNTNDNNNNQNNHDHDGNSSNIDKNLSESLQKQIDALKARMTKNQGFTDENIKDINLLHKDMKEAKQDIQNLKKQLLNLGNSGNNGKDGSNNLSANDNLNREIVNNLSKQFQQQKKEFENMENDMEKMKKHLQNLQKQVDELKNMQNQAFKDKKLMDSLQSNTNQNSDNMGNMDQKLLSDLMKKIEYLTKKSENMQTQLTDNKKCINELNDNVEANGKDIDTLNENSEKVDKQIEQINKMLQQLLAQMKQKNKSNNGDNEMRNKGKNSSNIGNKNNENSDVQSLMEEIQKLKEKYEKLLKMINGLKNQSKTSLQKISNPNNKEDTGLINGLETDRFSNSNKNNTKFSDRSFRKRSQSVDVNGKIRQLSERIKVLEKLLSGSEDNPQKLPAIGWKRPNQTAYNGEKSHKKQMSEMKNDLEIWIKSYLDNMNRGGNNVNLSDLELKIQQMRNALMKKADHEGMKKGLAFLEGKITQLYLFLTQPESEDAMIVRKGFNCLSCSKKVENLRGKLGPRMNWDNLNTTHNNMHTPPKTTYPKYHDSNERDSI